MRVTSRTRRFVFTVLLVVGSSWDLWAQVAGVPIPAEPPADTAPAVPVVAPDSPLASLRAFLDAANAGDWEGAARYLSIADDQQRSRRGELAERLKGVIDSRRLIDLEAVSGDSTGRLDDNLPPELEEVDVLVVEGVREPLRLVRTADAEGNFWAFSTTTVRRIDGWYAALPDRWIRDSFTGTRFDFLLRPAFFGILWWQWMALPILALISWGVGRVLRLVVRPLIGRLTARTATTWDDDVIASIGPPLTLALAILAFAVGAALLQLTRAGLAFVGGFTRAGLVFAFFWGLWRSSSVWVSWGLNRSWAVGNPSARSLLTIGSNILRGVIVGFGILAIIAAFGYPIATVLAGLGIGGLALAFGAQKTVENVFGSISLAVDQPFRIGDFVKVEDFVGTVEDIGLRSTRFRTLDRTIVSIPNGKLADQRLESFQARDRMRLEMTVGLTYGTTRRQMEFVLEGLEQALRTHPSIWPDATVVKFKNFAASSLDIEIMAWFQVPTWADFQLCRQQVLLEFMRVVEEAGASFAFPTRTVHLVQEGPADVGH